jgi:hypothetical protein
MSDLALSPPAAPESKPVDPMVITAKGAEPMQTDMLADLCAVSRDGVPDNVHKPLGETRIAFADLRDGAIHLFLKPRGTRIVFDFEMTDTTVRQVSQQLAALERAIPDDLRGRITLGRPQAVSDAKSPTGLRRSSRFLAPVGSFWARLRTAWMIAKPILFPARR